ncbi:MAG: hypothetical protein KDB80_16495, partial [Planctomycetes bacterium]|nr:hypothetical protein [Planctomycetota bacterium]
KQILAHLDGRMSLDEAIEQVKIRTRRYAKQQRTWLRRFRALPRAVWLDASETDAQTLVHKAFDAIMARAATPGAAGGPGASIGADSSRSS